jgi:CHAT domain-containing protein
MKRIYKLTGNEANLTNDTQELQGYTVSKSIEISHTRDGGQDLSIEVDDEEIAELQFDDQTFWMGRAGELPKLFGNDLEKRGSVASVITIPAFINSGNQERGFLKNVLIKAIKFFSPTSTVTEIVMKESAQLVDAYLQPNPGLYFLDSNFNKIPVTRQLEASDQPYLLFIHGTASSIHGSFHKMMETRQHGLWNNIVKTYGNRVLALDHYTLSVSPFENATEIAKWLPNNVKLHIISASRGGLVGEVISRYSSSNTSIGFTEIGKKSIMKAFGEESILNFEAALKGKKIIVEKFIRVACPGAGTTLLSERLDLFLNVLVNGINLIPAIAATGVIPVTKKLLADVLACKSKPEILPGLYAMNPKSDFIQVLNHPSETIDASLHVIAGNNKFELSLKGFITVLTKLFYRHENDWIVDTKSMSRGLIRSRNIGYFFDEGPEVNHFSYFFNKDTQQAISRVIDAPISAIAEGFESFDRTLLANAERGLIMANLMPKEVSGKKPILVLIPGILGSNLAQNGDEIYLNFLRIALGRMSDLSIDQPDVRATSLIGRFYSKFSNHFDDEYDVAIFPYDWRISLDTEAIRLNTFIKELMSKAVGQPIKIVAHSMGGLLTRQFISKNKSTWYEISANSEHKVVFLGSPLGGSFLIPEILVGKGKRIRQLAGLDLTHSTEELLNIFSSYDGLLGLLPVTNTPYDFSLKETWEEMKQKSTEYDWKIPSSESLTNFRNLQSSIRGFDTSIYESPNFIYVAGKSDRTVNGFYYDEQSGKNDQLTFTATAYGDGSVTWESGIPKEIKENGRAYYVPVSHGDLANEPDIFDGISEILAHGKTGLLSQNPLTREKQTSFDMPEELVEEQTQENLETVLFGASMHKVEIKNENPPITIELKCGDLKYATFPIMVGHLKSDGIMSAEKIVDDYFGNALSKRLATGNYPSNIGESRYFKNTNEKPSGAIIIGMGVTLKLSGYQLEEAIKFGLVDYLCSQEIDKESQRSVGISTLLLGCGYAGLNIETSIKAIISGAHKANELIRAHGDMSWPTIDTIELIEVYDDRALQALICLEGLNKHLDLNFVFQPKLQKLLGSRKRLNFENMTDWWHRISIEQESDRLCNDASGRTAAILFSSTLGAAREEVRRLYCSRSIIESLTDELSRSNEWDKELAKTIFELLIPNDFKLTIRNQQNLLLIVDRVTANYPWEMLQDVSIKASPLSVTAGMIRQLATEDFRQTVNYTQVNRALIIGDPQTNGYFAALPGALEEAKLVDRLFEENGFERVSSFRESSSSIVQHLFKLDYKIIHLAGHGVFDSKNPENSGMVIGNNVFLSVREIEQLSLVPEIVFINCCHLGKADFEAEKNSSQRYKLAANLGIQLINMGVKVVVAAGWAINDAAASDFTKDFYNCMFEGYTFGEAIKYARKKCYENYPNSNTWGAYQCYGDQFYTLTKTNTVKRLEKKKYYIIEQAQIDLENLINSIEASYSEEKKNQYIESVNAIISGVEAANLDASLLEEMEATFYKMIGEEKISLDLYKKLFDKSSNNFSMKAFEEYSRLKVKFYRKEQDGVNELQEMIKDLEAFCKIRKPANLFNVLGSAHKAVAEKKSGKGRNEEIVKAIKNYYMAYTLNKNAGEGDLIYSLTNCLILNQIEEELDLKINWLSELDWAYGQRKQWDGEMTFWDTLTESRYLICKFILEYDPKKKSAKIQLKRIMDTMSEAWNKGGNLSQKQIMLANFKQMFGFFNLPEKSALHAELEKLIDFLIKLI